MRTKDLEATVVDGLLQRRAILLTGKIEHKSIDQVCAAMLGLQIESNNPIILLIDSGGGSIYAALKLCDWVSNLITAPVIGVAIGSCHSAATFIMAHCTERMATLHTEFIIHSGTISGVSIQIKDEVSEEEVRQLLADIRYTKEVVIRTYMDKLKLVDKSGRNLTGQKRRDRVMELINRGDQRFDQAMSAEEAIEVGLVQRIVEGKLPIFQAIRIHNEPEDLEMNK